MPRIFALLLSLIVFIIGVSVVIVQILRFLGISRMSRSRREKERRILLEALSSQIPDLAPWKKDEIDLLSSKVEFSSKRDFFSKNVEGYIQTIYGEKVIPFAAKVFSTRQFICVLVTDKHNFTLMGLGNLTEVMIDNHKLGAIQNGTLIQNGKPLATIENRSGMYHPLIVSGVDLAHLRADRSVENDLVTHRLMEMVSEDLITGDTLPYLTGILCYDLINRVISKI